VVLNQESLSFKKVM